MSGLFNSKLTPKKQKNTLNSGDVWEITVYVLVVYRQLVKINSPMKMGNYPFSTVYSSIMLESCKTDCTVVSSRVRSSFRDFVCCSWLHHRDYQAALVGQSGWDRRKYTSRTLQGHRNRAARLRTELHTRPVSVPRNPTQTQTRSAAIHHTRTSHMNNDVTAPHIRCSCADGYAGITACRSVMVGLFGSHQ